MIGGGDMGQLVRSMDWSQTPLGGYDSWPQLLRSSLSLVLNAKGIAALYWGPDQWLLYNDAYGAALGDRHPQAFGRSMPEVLTDIGPVLSPQVAEVMRTGEGFSIESLAMTMRRHGREEETSWTYSFSPVQGEDGQVAGVLLLATERTEQVRAERARDEAQRTLSALNASLELDIEKRTVERNRVWDLSRDMLGVADANGVWLAVNPAWTQILGWQADDFVGRTSEWLEHPDDVAKTRSEVATIATGFTTSEFENRFRTKAGDYRALSWTAVPEGEHMYCVARDVTDDRARAIAMAEQLSVQERTWRYSPDLLSVIDMPSATFDRVNPAWTATLGWSIREIEGRGYEGFVHPDDTAASLAAFERVRGGNPVLRFQNRYRTKRGDWRSLSWVAFPEGDKLYASARDVTAETEQAEALNNANELIATKERAEQQQRELQNEMAHRIKNTLSMVKAIVSQTMRHARTKEEASVTIDQRIAALASAQDLLRQTTYTSASIHDVVRGALKVHLESEDRITLEGTYLDLPSQAALGLSLAIHELATNAAKYGALSDEMGHIRIAWQLAADGAFRFEWQEEGGPEVVKPERRGFGSRLTNQIVPSYFDGSGETQFTPEGLRYVLDGTLPNESKAVAEPTHRPKVADHG